MNQNNMNKKMDPKKRVVDAIIPLKGIG